MNGRAPCVEQDQELEDLKKEKKELVWSKALQSGQFESLKEKMVCMQSEKEMVLYLTEENTKIKVNAVPS